MHKLNIHKHTNRNYGWLLPSQDKEANKHKWWSWGLTTGKGTQKKSDFTAYIFEPPRLFLSVLLFVGKDFDWNVRLFTCIFPFRVATKSYFVLIRFHTLAYTIKHSWRISVAQRLVDSRGQLLHFDRWTGLTHWIACLSSPPTVFLSILIILLESHLRSDLYVRSIPGATLFPTPSEHHWGDDVHKIYAMQINH